jgi:hypothetical protein
MSAFVKMQRNTFVLLKKDHLFNLFIKYFTGLVFFRNFVRC